VISFVDHPSPRGFLDGAADYLREHEDRCNLVFGLALARVHLERWEEGVLFATVETAGDVVGCVMRTPPHKAIVTALPEEAAPVVAAGLSERYAALPAILGPTSAAERVAEAWVGLRGGHCRAGMLQGLYRVEEVRPPTGVPGVLRVATADDIDLACDWGLGFSRDARVDFPTRREAVERWVGDRALHMWDASDEPVSMAVARGRTERGVRVGFVYTPPEHRRHGFASALTAALSQKMLDDGCAFCVLYTDLSNPTSNAIYRRVGYELIEELRDFHLIAECE